MKFSEYIIEWHENRKPLIRASTFESESEYTYRQIAPFFADTELEDLKPLDIQKYVNSKLTSGRLDGKPGGLSVEVKAFYVASSYEMPERDTRAVGIIADV